MGVVVVSSGRGGSVQMLQVRVGRQRSGEAGEQETWSLLVCCHAICSKLALGEVAWFLS